MILEDELTEVQFPPHHARTYVYFSESLDILSCMTTWLMKSEPSEYSIIDLARDGQSSWFGVRNYLARNYMRDMMQVGDRVLFYHSSCPVPGIYGLSRVASAPHPDETQYEVG